MNKSAYDRFNSYDDRDDEEICELCLHSMKNNPHGLDQNDAYVDEAGNFVHSGTCTYCKVCRGTLD